MRAAVHSLAFSTLLLGCVVGSTEATAQSSSRTASDAYVSNIVARATNVPTGAQVNNVNLNTTRARAAFDGITNYRVQSSSISSGSGFSGRSAPPPAPSGPAVKPFSSVNSRPTVSPYLRLFDTGVAGGEASISNYQTLVRPRLQQQRFNEQVVRQQQQINARVQQISAQPDYRPTGSEQIMATGHPTTFGYTSHYYPSRGRRR